MFPLTAILFNLWLFVRLEALMIRRVFVVLLALFVVTRANAKSKRDVYPMSCDVLWSAVKETLQNPRDYGVLWVNDLNQSASFVVVGNLVRYTDKIALLGQDGGCKMKLTMLQVGPDNSDMRGFRNRLKRSLAKQLEAAKQLAAARQLETKPASASESKPTPFMGQQ